MTTPATEPSAAAFSAIVELHEDAATSALAVSNTNASIGVAPGAYLVFLEAANAAVTVYAKLHTTGATFTIPTTGTTEAGVMAFRGDAIERIRVKSDAALDTLNIRLSSGTATLVIVKLARE